METRNFLQRVLPAKGTGYFGAVGSSKGFAQSKQLDSIDALLGYVTHAIKGQSNVYFATGTYDTERKKNHTQYKCSLYVDIDCGESKEYPNKKSAVRAFKNFLSSTKFIPPTITVDSGNGIHAYWVLDEDIPIEKWQPMADALKSLCLDSGLRIDPAVTADSARILRVPNSVNYKDPSKPKDVRVLGSQSSDIPVEDMADALNIFNDTSAVEMLAGTVKDIHLGKPTLTTVEQKYLAEAPLKNCEVFKESLRTGGAEQPQDLWSLQLQVLSFAEDGADYIHEISEGHADYREKETNAKFQEKLTAKANNKGLGPASCEMFSTLMPEACKSCKFRGKQYSPIHIRVSADDEYAEGWRSNEHGVSRKIRIETEDGSVSYQWDLVSKLHILKMDVEERLLATGEKEMECVVIWKHSNGTTKRTAIPLKAMGKRADHAQQLIGKGIEYADSYNSKFMCEFFMSFLTKMNSKRATQTKAVTAMGWAGKNFHLPEMRITPEGNEPYSLGNANSADTYKAVGSGDAWIKLAKQINREKLPTADIGMLSGFAAPLVEFTEVDATVMSLNSPEGGSGKTTSMRMGQAVWGKTTVGMGSTKDTTTSMSSRLAAVGSIPGYLDDLRFDKDPKAQVDMVYGFTAGRDKGRSTTDGNLKVSAEWRTMITISSNQGVADRMSNYDNTNATSYRLFEVDVPPLGDVPPIDDSVLRTNYGVIGISYAEYLVANKDSLAKTYSKVQSGMAKAIKYREGPERFWLATMSTIMMAGMLTNKLGYTCIDLPKLRDFLISTYAVQVARTKQITLGVMTFEGTMERFLRENRDALVVVDAISKRNTSWGMVNDENVRSKIVGSINKESSELRVCRAELDNWCRQRGINSSMIQAGLDERGVKAKKANYSGGIAGTSSRSLCYDIPL